MKVPTLRFPQFSGEWEEKQLDEITDKIGDGLHATPIYDDAGDYYFINGNNLIDGKIVLTENTKKVNEDAFNKHKINLNNQTILMSINGTIGNIAFYNGEKVILGKSACYFNLKQNENRTFVFNILQTKKITAHFEKELTGSTIKNLSLTTIKGTKVSIPTIKEQQKIADFLTKIDEKIQQLTQKQKLLESYKKGVMQQLFSQQLRFKNDNGQDFPDWEEKQLEKLTKIYDGTHMTPNYTKTGIPFYSVEHITNNNFKDTKFIAREVFDKENERVKLEKGDVLMTKIGDIGTAKYIDWDVEASFYVSLALIKKTNKVNMLYLSHFIGTNFFQMELHQRTIHVAFPKKINLGEIGNCVVKIPHIKEQTKIANFLTAIDAKINLVEQQLTLTKEYKKGLLQQMFV